MASERNDAMLYREVQRFWLNRLLLAIDICLVVLTVALAVLPAALPTGADRGWALVGLGAPLLLTLASLKTEVSSNGVLYVGFHPIRRGRRAIAVREIERAEAVTYSPVGEFGGFGWRIGRGGSRAYNVAGNRGVRLDMVGGTSLVIGSQRPDALAAAIAGRMVMD